MSKATPLNAEAQMPISRDKRKLILSKKKPLRNKQRLSMLVGLARYKPILWKHS